MFFDYFRLFGMGGTTQAFDFMWRALFILVCALILTVVGFKLKRPWGAAVTLLYGVFVYLVNR